MSHQAAAVWIIAVVAVIFLLKAASQLLIPVVLAVLISYALEPVVRWMAAHRIPRAAGASIVLALIPSSPSPRGSCSPGWASSRRRSGRSSQVCNSIPYFGPVVVSGGLLVVGLVQAVDLMYALKIAGAALLITSLEGWLLTPPLMGKTERMHVLVVFLGVLVWTWIWGAWGTILAVPMLVIVKSVADHVEPLKPVSRLMAP